MTTRRYYQDLVAKIIGLCLTYDACAQGKVPTGDANRRNAKRLPPSVMRCLPSSSTAKSRQAGTHTPLVPDAAMSKGEAIALEAVFDDLERYRVSWNKHGDSRGWDYHFMKADPGDGGRGKSAGRLNRPRVSELVTGKNLTSLFSKMESERGYFEEHSKDVKRIIIPKSTTNVLDKHGKLVSLGGGAETWEFFSFLLGCGVEGNKKYLERMDFHTAREIDPSEHLQLNMAFTGQSEEGPHVTPAPDSFVLRVACAFGFGRGSHNDPSAADTDDELAQKLSGLTFDAWSDGWTGMAATERKKIWELFAGIQRGDGPHYYFGAPVDKFLKAYHEFLMSNDFLSLSGEGGGVTESRGRKGPEAPDDESGPRQLILRPLLSKIGQPVSVSLDLRNDNIGCDIKAGSNEKYGTFAFNCVWVSIKLGSSLSYDRQSITIQAKHLTQDGQEIFMDLEDLAALRFKFTTAENGMLPAKYLISDEFTLFRVLNAVADARVHVELDARMQDLAGTLETGETNSGNLLERVLAAHEWAKANGETTDAWLEDTGVHKPIFKQQFEFRERSHDDG